MKTKMILAGLLLIGYSGFSQSVSWKETPSSPSQFSGHGNLSIAIDRTTDDIYVGTFADGIYRSNNRGESWEQVVKHGKLVNKIVVTDKFIYATGRNRIYRSDDHGNSWKEFPVPCHYALSDLVVLSTGVVAISSAEIKNITDITSNYVGDGIFISKDNGVSWEFSSDGLNPTKAVVHLAVDSKDRLFAATSHEADLITPPVTGGLYYRFDDELKWKKIDPIFFTSGKNRESIKNIYTVTALETDANNNIYFGYEGSGGNFQTAGSFHNTFENAVQNPLEWTPVKLRSSGYEWDFKPLNSIFFAQNGDQYASLHAPLSRVIGGPYAKLTDQSQWKRAETGMTAPMVGDEFGYRQCEFAETSTGEVYAVQQNDARVYMAHKYTPTGIAEKLEDNISVYPNPANDVISIDAGRQWKGKLTCSLFTIEGKEVMPQTAVADGMINIAHLSDGLYILNLVSTDGEMAARKIRISH